MLRLNSRLISRPIHRYGLTTLLLFMLLTLSACQRSEPEAQQAAAAPEPATTPASEVAPEPADAQPSRYDIYATVRLTADLSHLSENQRKMIPLLIEAAAVMDELFWKQCYGDKEALLSSIHDPAQRRFAVIHYGNCDRLAAEQPS